MIYQLELKDYTGVVILRAIFQWQYSRLELSKLCTDYAKHVSYKKKVAINVLLKYKTSDWDYETSQDRDCFKRIFESETFKFEAYVLQNSWPKKVFLGRRN